MRIAFLISELMMNTMCSHPEDGTAFESERRTDGQKILDPLRGPVTTMGEQPMIAHPDAEASRYPPQQNRNEESFPSKEEQRCNSTQVKGGHKKCGDPVDLIVGGLLSFELLKLHHC